ncbi:acetyl-CoA carboxylase [Gleimia hominis]|uniref:Acetyl-CoA carboxylase n=1 Tax=Gleimia hominis TaxID=595468 RepID=A0ABU3ICP6_9ACTO|nr:acetyl-CoA carboxylase [Gleimia hominis]MDT3768154.1 acetyl-CoA carboxylase [Gleimia hominis]
MNTPETNPPTEPAEQTELVEPVDSIELTEPVETVEHPITPITSDPTPMPAATIAPSEIEQATPVTHRLDLTMPILKDPTNP